MSKRTIVIGDIHGCLLELNQLLTKINYTKEDRCVIAGDLLDRGPYSVEVVRRVRELGLECVKGNHDEKHILLREARLRRIAKKRHPIILEGNLLEIQMNLSEEDYKFLDQMPTVIKLHDNWIVVHAGLEPYKTLEEQKSDKLLHIRWIDPITLKTVKLGKDYLPQPGSVFWTSLYKGPHSVIYGHNVHSLSDPTITEISPGVQTVGLDTGACFGGRLTCMIFTEDGKITYEYVQALEVYSEKKNKRL